MKFYEITVTENSHLAISKNEQHLGQRFQNAIEHAIWERTYDGQLDYVECKNRFEFPGRRLATLVFCTPPRRREHVLRISEQKLMRYDPRIAYKMLEVAIDKAATRVKQYGGVPMRIEERADLHPGDLVYLMQWRKRYWYD